MNHVIAKGIIFFRLSAYILTCCAQMASMPGGAFTMGTNDGEADEGPAHAVTVSAVSIDRFEVSLGQYDSCVALGRCTAAHYDDGKCLMWTSDGIARVQVPEKYRVPELPVVCVTWRQAYEYCKFRGGRLPTEAEWEYTALAGSEDMYAWGDRPPDESLCTQASNRHPAKTGSYPSNAAGLHDMTGNVWEWTADMYQTDYYAMGETDNPKGPEVGRYRVIRGGGWYSTAYQLRIKNRQWFVPEYGEVSVGIRCVK